MKDRKKNQFGAAQRNYILYVSMVLNTGMTQSKPEPPIATHSEP